MKYYRAKEILWQYFVIKEGQLAELGKLAFVALVTTFLWQQNFSEKLFCSQHPCMKHLETFELIS